MNAAKKHLKLLVLLGCALAFTTIILVGCKKKESAAPTVTKEVASAEIEQKTCPVMGGEINKSLFTEYKGKKVYFCCAACKEEFEKNPEKYIAKLPQFKK